MSGQPLSRRPALRAPSAPVYFGCFFAGTASVTGVGVASTGALKARLSFVFFPVRLSK